MRVCQEWFPKGTYPGQKDDGFYMEDILKAQLDLLLKNIVRDWDFTIIITGGGEVRVGKSVLAMQIAAYWTYQIWKLYGIKVPFDLDTNFVFNGKELIKAGNALGRNYKYAALDFDEAGADLQAKKTMSGSTQDLLDYFRECGQYNMLNILVLPDFFDLPMGIALTRSTCLIDVYYNADGDGLFERGYFNFYGRRAKKRLYLFGKKFKDYHAAAYDFHGRFYQMYPIDEKKYKQMKQDALNKREAKQTKAHRWLTERDAAWYLLQEVYKIPQIEIVEKLSTLLNLDIPKNTISSAVSGLREKLEKNKILKNPKIPFEGDLQ